jgi:hypothetical protein
MGSNRQFVKGDLMYGCEMESVRLAGIYLERMFESNICERLLSNNKAEKDLWKKMYLSFMRKHNIIDVSDRHAYQVLYALSRYFNVCRVQDNMILWVCTSVNELKAKMDMGMMRTTLYLMEKRLAQANDEIERLRTCEQGEIVDRAL